MHPPQEFPQSGAGQPTHGRTPRTDFRAFALYRRLSGHAERDRDFAHLPRRTRLALSCHPEQAQRNRGPQRAIFARWGDLGWGTVPIAFTRVVSYAQCMELLTHDELVRLTPPERLTLISQLWDSLEDNHLPLTAAQRGELDRRLATLDEDRREGITWAALKSELELRCP